MLTMITDKRANGRRMIYLVIEPQDITHMKTGQPCPADSSNIQGHDILVCYAPDGEKFRNMIAAEIKNLDPTQSSDAALLNFGELLKAIQQQPEVHRPVKSAPAKDLRQDVGKKAN